jgi:ketosteroid isomerase-like protein
MLFDNLARTFTYSAPDIKEVPVDGDLATVRLIWTLIVKDASCKVAETVRDNVVDVFRRQPDGRWKIHVSHAFTQEG